MTTLYRPTARYFYKKRVHAIVTSGPSFENLVRMLSPDGEKSRKDPNFFSFLNFWGQKYHFVGL
jgi:hypothetical protein